MASTATPAPPRIKAIDHVSVHRIASGQVIIDLQTAVKELVENSLDAGATTIEVRFKQCGLAGVEVVDNGFGIAEEDWEGIGLKHYTSKLSTFDDLSTVRTFGFRGEAISSLCAVCESVVVTTATQGPMGIQLDLEQSGSLGKKTKIARQRGTTVFFTSLFASLPVRRKELQRNIKREFGKALGLLNAYALGPCAGMDGSGHGVRMTVTNQLEKGQKAQQIKTDGTPSFKASLTALWGPKAMDNTVELDLDFHVHREKSTLKQINEKYSQHSQSQSEDDSIPIQVKGLISKFSVACGRTGTDRQFFYVNGRPCSLTKVQKAFNEVYRTFNANQSPFILADFIVPAGCCDINVSPDKRTIFLQREQRLIDALKDALETAFAPHRSTFDVSQTQRGQSALTQMTFNSPFSKRLSVKAGASISKPSPTAQNSVPLDSEHPADGEERSDESQNATFTMSPPQPDEPEGSPRPVAKKIHQLLKVSSSGSSKAHHVEGATSAKGKGEKLEQSQKAARVTGTDPVAADRMEVDEPPTGGSPRDDEVPEPVVIDTTKAIWSQFNRKESTAEKRADEASESVEDSEQPMAKKRRVEAETDHATSARADQPTKDDVVAKRKSLGLAVAALRGRLAQFASGGGGVAGTEGERGSGGGERIGEDRREEEEEANEVEELTRKGTRSNDFTSVELIKPSFRVISLAKNEKRKTGNKPQDPIEVDDDEDVRMEEDVVQFTSSTIAVPEHQRTEDVDSSVDQPTSSLTPATDGATSQENTARLEVVRRAETSLRNVTVRFDLEQVKDAWESGPKDPAPSVEETSCAFSKVSADASLTNTKDNESAMHALERVIDKSDFAGMNVIGQFNLGFIIVRRRKMVRDEQGDESGIIDDLFIVDQHAADEKYNFETLQQTTRIQSQKLFKPRHLELTAADELVAIENIEVLTENGFEIEVDDTANAGQGAKLRVMAFPVSKSTEFDMKDLEELITLMRDQPSGKMVRCSKARAMFAMRACRKSVMIGTALSQNQMVTVVHHMGTIDQPWNCPHGRPTMRHLIDLSHDNFRKGPKTINWSAIHKPK